MKKLVLLSGKGGTGKTTLAGAFAILGTSKAVADCDVDAPNLHMILSPDGDEEVADFYGLQKAKIDPEKCTDCGLCETVCRFGAIKDARVDVYACEGCGVCEEFCPAGAISMTDHVAGKTKLFKSADAVFSTASLRMGSGNTGKLVTEVKKQLFKHAKKGTLAILDGSPGIGCPVIASITGADMVLMVAEPTVSGMSDLVRVVKSARILKARIGVCVNKWDINEKIAEDIERYCCENEIGFLGRIPYDPAVVRSHNAGRPATEGDGPAQKAIRDVYLKTVQILYEQ